MGRDDPSFEPGALGECYRRLGGRLALYARQYLPPDIAEETVQDVFVKLIAQRHRPRCITGWLFTAVRHAAISRLRSVGRRRQRERGYAQARPEWFTARPEDLIDARSAQTALEALPLELREAVVLRIWGGRTFEQIGEIVGVETSAAFRRYRRALSQLRERMDTPCETTKT